MAHIGSGRQVAIQVKLPKKSSRDDDAPFMKPHDQISFKILQPITSHMNNMDSEVFQMASP